MFVSYSQQWQRGVAVSRKRKVKAEGMVTVQVWLIHWPSHQNELYFLWTWQFLRYLLHANCCKNELIIIIIIIISLFWKHKT